MQDDLPEHAILRSTKKTDDFGSKPENSQRYRSWFRMDRFYIDESIDKCCSVLESIEDSGDA